MAAIALGLDQCHPLSPPTAAHSEPEGPKEAGATDLRPHPLCPPPELLLGTSD